MTEPRGTGLQTIFGFFLGLMVTAFIGVGVYTFYPPQDQALQDHMRELRRQQEEIHIATGSAELTPEHRATLLGLQRELDTLEDQSHAATETWGRRTSIVLIALATATMAVSLLRAVQLPVISNGLLLGGVFTMVYGVGWIISTDSSTVRFFVMTAALVITLALGYIRFVRQRDAVPSYTPAQSRTSPAESVGDLERRVQQLEQRLKSVADALGSGGDRPS